MAGPDDTGRGPEILWAPWRIGYIENVEKTEGCLFCVKAAERDDRGNLIVHRGVRVFAMLNRYPYNNGHLMLVPVRHTAEPGDLDDAEKIELFDLLTLSKRVLTDTLRPQGFNAGLNLGRAAGAGIADHLHLHVVPRWNGDTNFMPVLAGTKVVSEGLESTRDRLAERFAALTAGAPGPGIGDP